MLWNSEPYVLGGFVGIGLGRAAFVLRAGSTEGQRDHRIWQASDFEALGLEAHDWGLATHSDILWTVMGLITVFQHCYILCRANLLGQIAIGHSCMLPMTHLTIGGLAKWRAPRCTWYMACASRFVRVVFRKDNSAGWTLSSWSFKPASGCLSCSLELLIRPWWWCPKRWQHLYQHCAMLGSMQAANHHRVTRGHASVTNRKPLMVPALMAQPYDHFSRAWLDAADNTLIIIYHDHCTLKGWVRWSMTRRRCPSVRP